MNQNTPAHQSEADPQRPRHKRLTPDAFVENAKTLAALGWPPLPLGGPNGKALVARGVTGYDGVDVSDEATLREWGERFAPTPDGLNLGVRMPFGVIAIDVDCYDGKQGAATLTEHEQLWGAVPPTWSVTARSDGSRKLFFRVPDDWTGRGVLGPGVELVQRHHRYSVAPPSVHDAGIVRALTPDGRDGGQLPPPAELPVLPEAWLTGLAHDAPHSPKGSDADATDLNQHFRDGAMTAKVQQHLNDFLDAVAGNSNRYDHMRDAVMALVRLGAKGERGVDAALRLIEAVYVDAVADKRGGEDIARDEYRKAKRGAERIVVGDPRFVALDFQCGEAFSPGGVWGPGSSWVLSGVDETDGAELWSRTGATPSDYETAGEDASDGGLDRAPSSSWAPVDVGLALSAGPPPPPTVLHRDDGLCLFYAGKVHSVHGESESGKSWLVQYAAAQELLADGAVLYVDFEDSVESVVGRLLALGVAKEVLTDRSRFVYARPEEAPRSAAAQAAFLALISQRFTLAVIDGVTDSMGMFGYSAKDNDDIAAWQRELPRRVASASEAAVVCIDHVTKDADTRGRYAIGGQHKIAGLDGAAYTVEVHRPFAVGRAGAATVRVGKDRPGHVRQAGVGWRKTDRTQLVAEFTLTSAGADEVTCALTAPAAEAARVVGGGAVGDGPTAAVGASAFRPTWFMEQISRHLEGDLAPEQRSQNKIVRAMCEAREAAGKPQKRQYWRTALEVLVGEGYVATATGEGRRPSTVHSSVKRYRQTADPEAEAFTGGTEPTRFSHQPEESTPEVGVEP